PQPDRRSTSGPVTWSADGRRFAYAVHRREEPPLLVVVDAATGKDLCRIAERHDRIRHVALSPDGGLLAAVCADAQWVRQLRLWDAATGKFLRAVPTGKSPSGHAVVFSPDGRLIASDDPGQSVRLLDTATLQPVRTLTGPQWYVTGLAFRPDGKEL